MPEIKFFLNMCIAICVDAATMKEIAIVGESKNVFEYIKSENPRELKCEDLKIHIREIGAALFDLSGECRMGNYLKLSLNKGNGCTMSCNNEVPNFLKEITISNDNVICNYLKKVIDKALLSSIDEGKLEWLLNHLEITQTALINDSFIDYQRHMSFMPPKIPNTKQMLDYLLKNYVKDTDDISMIMVKDNTGKEYAVTDVSVVSIVEYYIRQLYDNNLFPRYCLNCGKLFIAKTSLFDVLCSDTCRKQRNFEKVIRYKKNHNDEYEAEYMKVYQRWYTRIRRAKEKGLLTGDNLQICNDIFLSFTSKSYEMRNDVRSGKISSMIYTQWLGNFDIQMNKFWSNIKAVPHD